MTYVYKRFDHAGMIVEILHDDSGAGNPQENDNAGTIYSWTRDFLGDKVISRPDNEDYEQTLEEWFADHYGSVLTLPLHFADLGSNGSRIRVTTDDAWANCALVFTGKEVEEEWGGFIMPKNENNLGAMNYAKARIEELDQWLQGNVWCIRIKERTLLYLPPAEDERGRTLITVCGFIGDPDGEYIQEEAEEMAEGAREEIDNEIYEANYWAARDVETVEA